MKPVVLSKWSGKNVDRKGVWHDNYSTYIFAQDKDFGYCCKECFSNWSLSYKYVIRTRYFKTKEEGNEFYRSLIKDGYVRRKDGAG